MNSKMLFSNRDIRKLVIPIIMEQLLNAIMGTVDTVMVSSAGNIAVSAVSLVDTINVLVLQVFVALASGGVVICSHYLGKRDPVKCLEAARQLYLAMTVISVATMAVSVFARRMILHAVFGSVEPAVMEASLTYFLITALSYPFLALYNANVAFFRAEKDSRTPMIISVLGNVTNVCGNAVLIFIFHMGVAGAGIATLASRIMMAVIMIVLQRRPRRVIVIRNYFVVPDFKMIRKILSIGVPSGVENGMFQFGKLVVQSTVSSMGTMAIAAQAIAIPLENLSGIAAIGIGIALMTVVGHCMGANEKEQARYYILKLTLIAEAILVVGCVIIYVLAKPVTVLCGLEPESASLCVQIMHVICIVKPILWIFAFIPPYGMRAAGDVKFPMLVTSCTMWLCRVFLSIFLVRVAGFGLMAVWIGMFADWVLRSLFFAVRFFRGKWMNFVIVNN